MNYQSFYLEVMRKLQEGLHLESEEAKLCVQGIFQEQFTEIQIAALLMRLSAKGESVSEVVGFVHGMRDYAVRLNHQKERLVDTAGTGGDGSGTFNVSTGAAFVIAGAGVPVAKHGNRAISGRCGSADVLTRLGVNVDAPKEILEECLAETGITFLFAPSFHPAMKKVGRVRKELGVRTIFNLLGPLLNPAGARRQIIGVYAPHLTNLLGEALQQLGCEHALVFSGLEGLDEISLGGATKITELKDGTLKTTHGISGNFRIFSPASSESIQAAASKKMRRSSMMCWHSSVVMPGVTSSCSMLPPEFMSLALPGRSQMG